MSDEFEAAVHSEECAARSQVSEPRAALKPPGVSTQSLLRDAPAIVLLAIVLADIARYADPDLWGHVLFGLVTYHSGRLVRTDPYSYSAAGHVWLNHEWLCELLMGWLYQCWGVRGLKLLKFLCSAATITFVAAAEDETGASLPLRSLLLMSVAFALIPQMQFRPQVFTFAFVAALIAGITRDNYDRPAPLWLSVPLFALWANLHGGFFIGIVILAIYTGVRAVRDFAEHRGVRHTLQLTAVTAAAAFATLLTPYGIATWFTVAHSLSNPMTRHIMADWRPLMVVVSDTLHDSGRGLGLLLWVVVMLAAAALSFVLTPRGDDLPLVAVSIVMSAAAFISVRNMALAVIAASPVLSRHLTLLMAGLRVRLIHERSHPVGSAALSRLTQIFFAVAALVLAIASGLFTPRIRTAADYPSGAVAFMESHDLHGNILNSFIWGQYLIWHVAPRSKIFIDSRFDLTYPPQVIRDYLAFYFLHSDAARVLERYPHDFVLISPKAPVYTFMAGRKDWTEIYHDAGAALFAKSVSPAARIPLTMVRTPIGPGYFP